MVVDLNPDFEPSKPPASQVSIMTDLEIVSKKTALGGVASSEPAGLQVCPRGVAVQPAPSNQADGPLTPSVAKNRTRSRSEILTPRTTSRSAEPGAINIFCISQAWTHQSSLKQSGSRAPRNAHHIAIHEVGKPGIWNQLDDSSGSAATVLSMNASLLDEKRMLFLI